MASAISGGVLILSGLFCLLTAVSSGLQPSRFAGQLGLSLANAGGATEIRAQYAGFFLALGLLCFAPFFGIVTRQTACIALIITFGGLLAGRLVSVIVNSGIAGFPPMIVTLYLIDALGLGLSIAALIAEQR